MPRSLDPGSRLTMVLASDLDKPKESQPRIFAKQPSLNQQRKLIGLLESLKDGNALEQLDAIIDVASTLITGWENIPLSYSKETLGDVLNLDELVEVLAFLVGTSHPTADDKKKSESQPS